MPVTDRSAPIFYVRVAPGTGAESTPLDLSDRVTSFRYEDKERAADRLTLTVDNSDLLLFDDPAFKPGMHLEVTWGYVGAMAPARVCVVTKISGSLSLSVEARALSVLMNTKQQTRTFTGMRVSDVARRLARDYGYETDRIDIEETPNVLATIPQSRLTDAQFLRRLAEREGFEFWIDHEGFHFHTRRVDRAPVRVLTYFIDQEGGDILDGWSIEDDITARPARTRARGRDPLERQDIDEEGSDETDRDRSTLASIRAIPDPETGAIRVEREVGQAEIHPTSAPDASTARREARGRFRRTQQTAVKMRVPIIGDPDLLAKTVIEIRGMGRRLSQRYYVRDASHTIDGSGYTTELNIVSDGHGGHATESRLARGTELLEVAGTQTRGRPNDEPTPPSAEPGAPAEGAELETYAIPDPETGAIVTRYRDSRGRRASGTGGGANG